jgi:hypothetical protein
MSKQYFDLMKSEQFSTECYEKLAKEVVEQI